MESLTQLAESMRQASALLSDEDPDDSSKQGSGFLSVVALGNVVSLITMLCLPNVQLFGFSSLEHVD